MRERERDSAKARERGRVCVQKGKRGRESESKRVSKREGEIERESVHEKEGERETGRQEERACARLELNTFIVLIAAILVMKTSTVHNKNHNEHKMT